MLNEECEKHDLSCLVPDRLSAETSAGGWEQIVPHREWMLQGNLVWPINSSAYDEEQIYLFLMLTCPLSSQADVIYISF